MTFSMFMYPKISASVVRRGRSRTVPALLPSISTKLNAPEEPEATAASVTMPICEGLRPPSYETNTRSPRRGT